jgi:hypothetical protein
MVNCVNNRQSVNGGQWQSAGGGRTRLLVVDRLAGSLHRRRRNDGRETAGESVMQTAGESAGGPRLRAARGPRTSRERRDRRWPTWSPAESSLAAGGPRTSILTSFITSKSAIFWVSMLADCGSWAVPEL